MNDSKILILVFAVSILLFHALLLSLLKALAAFPILTSISSSREVVEVTVDPRWQNFFATSKGLLSTMMLPGVVPPCVRATVFLTDVDFKRKGFAGL